MAPSPCRMTHQLSCSVLPLTQAQSHSRDYAGAVAIASARFRGAVALLIAVFFAIALLSARPAAAHPHSWIHVQSTVLFAEDGRVTAIEQQWTFDELYTTYVVEEMAGGKKPSPKVVGQFASKVLANLESFGYFLSVTVDGQPAKLARVTQYASEMRGQRLWLRFVAPLAVPAHPLRQAVAFSVFDPTYYIAMEHPDPRAVRLTGAAPAACSSTLERPTPAASVLARAFSMDAGAPADDTLGRQFAQKVVLTCR